jgi:hypothetical protein
LLYIYKLCFIIFLYSFFLFIFRTRRLGEIVCIECGLIDRLIKNYEREKKKKIIRFLFLLLLLLFLNKTLFFIIIIIYIILLIFIIYYYYLLFVIVHCPCYYLQNRMGPTSSSETKSGGRRVGYTG